MQRKYRNLNEVYMAINRPIKNTLQQILNGKFERVKLPVKILSLILRQSILDVEENGNTKSYQLLAYQLTNFNTLESG